MNLVFSQFLERTYYCTAGWRGGLIEQGQVYFDVDDMAKFRGIQVLADAKAKN